MKSLVKKYKKDPILVIGNEHIGNVARFYGFEKVVTSQHIFDWNPSVWPFKKPTEQMKELEHTQIAAILMMYDSTDWGHDLQVMLDVLRSDQGRLGTLAKDSKKQSVPLYFSNSDLVWANDFPVDRLAQGSFRLALETLYKKLTGHELEYTKFGKPERVTYEYAAKALQEQADNLGRQVDRIFAVGDNPASDIIGANNHGWSSILVRSGVWKGDTHDHGALHIADNVEEAVTMVIGKGNDH
jgi:HAD superfamily hydrolase (TIGR01456 family)